MGAPKRKTKKKRAVVSLTTLKRLRAKACFKRDGFMCVRCGQVRGLAPSHVFPKGRYPNMAWDMQNIKTLCLGCHLYWWHLNPIQAHDWFKKKFPGRYRYLKELSNKTLPKPDLLVIKKLYEDIIDE